MGWLGSVMARAVAVVEVLVDVLVMCMSNGTSLRVNMQLEPSTMARNVFWAMRQQVRVCSRTTHHGSSPGELSTLTDSADARGRVRGPPGSLALAVGLVLLERLVFLSWPPSSG